MRAASATKRCSVILVAIVMVIAAGCGSDDDNGGGADTGGNTTPTGQDNGDSGGGGGGPSTLVVDGESIDVGNARCHLEPQEAAGGDGMITATAQVSGTNAAGDDVVLDFTRYDEDSMFHGDDITLDIGDFGDVASLLASLDEGTVDVSGNVVSADDVSMTDPAAGVSAVVSFELSC